MTHFLYHLLDHLPARAAAVAPDACALADGQNESVLRRTRRGHRLRVPVVCSNSACKRGERFAIWLDKRFESVIAAFAAARAGGVFRAYQFAAQARPGRTHPARAAMCACFSPLPNGTPCWPTCCPPAPICAIPWVTSAGAATAITWAALMTATPQVRHRVIDRRHGGNFLHLGQHRPAPRA